MISRLLRHAQGKRWLNSNHQTTGAKFSSDRRIEYLSSIHFATTRATFSIKVSLNLWAINHLITVAIPRFKMPNRYLFTATIFVSVEFLGLLTRCGEIKNVYWTTCLFL